MRLAKQIFCRAYQTGFRIALPVLPYHNPKLLSSLSQIPALLRKKEISRVLLVIDGGVRRLGLTQEFENQLAKSQIVFAVYEQNTPNPTIDDVEKARRIYVRRQCKAIIAIGGGSAMDCAKVCGARIARPKKPVSKMRGLLKVTWPTPLLIAVPTTAGTGSETTLAAVITDAKTSHKYPINDFALIPDYAVLDPALTMDLPPQITATTGLDALTHAVEAYIGRSTNSLTRRMSEEAVALIYQNLETAVADGHNKEARANMLRAAYCAGVSFTRSYVGYVHGIAHSLGGQYHIAHGYANAIILPQFLEIYGDTCTKKLARLARRTHIVPKLTDDQEAAGIFIDWIYDLNDKFGLPKGFPEIRAADIPVMAKHADKESNPLYPVPKLMDARELADVYRQLMIKEDR